MPAFNTLRLLAIVTTAHVTTTFTCNRNLHNKSIGLLYISCSLLRLHAGDYYLIPETLISQILA